MGTASAIPDHLITYADQATGPKSPNAELQTWIRNILTAAILEYRRTAKDFGNAIPGLTSAGGGASTVYGTFDHEVLQALRTLADADRPVRHIGEAFARAGAPSKDSTTTAADRSKYSSLVASDDATVERLRKRAEGEELGRRLVEHVDKHGFDRHALEMLKKYGSNPYFAATFLNSLNPEQIYRLLDFTKIPKEYRKAIVGLVVNAYASGEVTNATSQHIWGLSLESIKVRALDARVNLDLDKNLSRLDLARALQNNPAAAYHFVRGLEDNQLRQLMQNYEVQGKSLMPEVVKIMAAGFQYPHMDPHEYQVRTSKLIQQSYPKDPDTFSVESYKETVKAIGLYISSYLPHRVDPDDPAAVGRDAYLLLEQWSDWLTKIKESLGDEYEKAVDRAGLAAGVLFSIVTAPAGPLAGVVFGAIFSLATQDATDHLKNKYKEGFDKNTLGLDDWLKRTTQLAAQSAALTHLLRTRRILGPNGGPVDPTDLYTATQPATDISQYRVAGTKNSSGDPMTVEEYMRTLDSTYTEAPYEQPSGSAREIPETSEPRHDEERTHPK